MRRICVFCGSSSGSRPEYRAAAEKMAAELVRNNIGLIYGGGNVGLMGVIADAVLRAGGEAQGVIPENLMVREVGHNGLTRGGDVDAAWPTCEAVRNPECAGVLLAAAGDVRSCSRGAVPEAGEPGAGTGTGIASRTAVSTSGVVSVACREMAGSGDAVTGVTSRAYSGTARQPAMP